VDEASAPGPRLAPIPFYYLRHGQTDWNRERICQGQTDVPLNETGRTQAHAAKALLEGHAIETICCSPLARAYETAEIVNQALGRPIVVLDALKEIAFGIKEGGLVDEWFWRWLDGEATPKGAEPFQDFLHRALGAVNRALAHPGPVLIVAHGGIYWAVQRFGPLEDRQTIGNAVPLHHAPPTAERPGWQTRILE
jgi:probable phosphoglycerate mutase